MFNKKTKDTKTSDDDKTQKQLKDFHNADFFTSRIPAEPNIDKICRNCGKHYKTRFPQANECSLKCQREWREEEEYARK